MALENVHARLAEMVLCRPGHIVTSEDADMPQLRQLMLDNVQAIRLGYGYRIRPRRFHKTAFLNLLHLFLSGVETRQRWPLIKEELLCGPKETRRRVRVFRFRVPDHVKCEVQ